MSADFTHAVLAFGNNLRDEYGFAAAQAKSMTFFSTASSGTSVRNVSMSATTTEISESYLALTTDRNRLSLSP